MQRVFLLLVDNNPGRIKPSYLDCSADEDTVSTV